MSRTISINHCHRLPDLRAGLLFVFRLPPLLLPDLLVLLLDECFRTALVEEGVFEFAGLPFLAGGFGFDFLSSTPDDSSNKL